MNNLSFGIEKTIFVFSSIIKDASFTSKLSLAKQTLKKIKLITGIKTFIIKSYQKKN